MPADPAKKYPITEIQGPDLRPTGQVPAALRTERLVESLVETVSKIDAKLDSYGAALTTVAADVSRLKAESEERARKHSGGIARVSENDSKQDSAIGVLVSKVDGLEKTTQETQLAVDGLEKTQETQLAILKRLDAVAANPMVRRVAYAVGGAVLAYLAAKGYR